MSERHTRIQADAVSVAFEVKTDARAIHIRLVDGKKQTFQVGRRLNGKADEWQQVTFPVAASKIFWGGPRDGPMVSAPEGTCDSCPETASARKMFRPSGFAD